VGIGDVDFGETVAQWPGMVYWLSAVHHDDQGTFAAKEIDEQLEEGIDGKGLLNL